VSRVLIVALDALDATLLRRLLAEGRLPSLAQFASQSQSLDVHSGADFLAGSVWPTFATGQPPGHHGIYGSTQWLAEEGRHVRVAPIAAGLDPFWSALVPHGRTATVIDLPYMPVVEAPGFRGCAGWGLHGELVASSYPAGFRAWIDKTYGRHPLRPDTVEPQSPAGKLALARQMHGGLQQRARLLEELAGRRDWDLLLTTLDEVHLCGHYLASDEQLAPGTSNVDAMVGVVGALEEAWPRILAAAGSDCHVLLLAVHGMTEQFDYEMYGSQMLSLFAGRNPNDWHAHPDLLRRLRDLLPDALHRAIWQTLPGRWRESRLDSLDLAAFNLERDRLFSLVHEVHPAVRVNLQGREQTGIVPAADVPALLDGLEAFISGFTTDDGRPAFTGVWRTAVEEPGPRSHRLPDALILANPAVTRIAHLRAPDGSVLASRRLEARNGVHVGRGFCYLRPAGEMAATRPTADNLDFAPSILDLLGVPHDRDFAGSSFVA
jgi:predicted AlkP superfamily phosphohydrolase/phosphomutase